MDRQELYEEIMKTKHMDKLEAREKTRRTLRKLCKQINHELLFITDDEVLAKDYSHVHKFFNKLDRQWRAYKCRVMLVVDGYDDIPDELYEIPEVKSYFRELYRSHPQYLYYLSEVMESFQMALLLLMDEHAKSHDVTETFIERLEKHQMNIEAFEEEMERLRIDITARLDNELYDEIMYHLMIWGNKKNDIQEALALANKFREFKLNM